MKDDDEDTYISASKEELIGHYKRNGYLSTEDVVKAFRIVPREKFIGSNPKKYAYLDRPLPILENQTISAPHMVAMMISRECLNLNVGDICLEVGAGSGYHAAVIAEIVAPLDVDKSKWGHVYSIERIAKLVEFAKTNLKETGYSNRVSVYYGDGSLGLPEKAPFDKITVAAAAPAIPPPLIKQLKTNGRIVIPVGGKNFYQELIVAEKQKDGTVKSRSVCGVAFVPLIGEHGY